MLCIDFWGFNFVCVLPAFLLPSLLLFLNYIYGVFVLQKFFIYM